MGFQFIKKLPTPDEIRQEYPLPQSLTTLKQVRDEEIKKVITGESNKFLVIIGPCSADNEDSVCDYINRLAKINDKVKDKLLKLVDIKQDSLRFYYLGNNWENRIEHFGVKETYNPEGVVII